MESIIESLGQAMGYWWWYGKDGQTKTANFCDDWVFPIVIAVSLSVLVVMVWWLLM